MYVCVFYKCLNYYNRYIVVYNYIQILGLEKYNNNHNLNLTELEGLSKINICIRKKSYSI